MEAKDKTVSFCVTEETKCQHNFKCVLANNSYDPFKHLKIHENSKDLHPYESKIKTLLEKPQLDVNFSNGTMGDMKDTYVWVDDEGKLKQLVEVLSNQRVFAVDTEQHSLRSFLGFTALIQISTRDDEDYLVDTIALHDVMGILRPVFANPNICKVFHGANNDVIWLQRDFHIYVACDVLSKPHRSLAYLLETYCGVVTNKFYQREDWRQRPLPKDMLEYARMDAHYLMYIADCLVAELKLHKNGNPASLDDNKFDFVYEANRRSNGVCLQLFTKELEASPGQSAASSIISRHLNDPGSSTNNGQFQGIVRRLCCWRDLMARVHDESLKYVLSDNAIVALAEKVPVTEADISTTISQADSNSTTISPSCVVISHLVDLVFLLQGELQNHPDEILQLYIKKHLGPNGSCPLSLYNYGLVSKSNIEVPKRLVSEENGYKFSKVVARKDSRELFVYRSSRKSPVYQDCRMYDRDGQLLCYCDRGKLEWYLRKNLAKLVDEDPPAIMLLFERTGGQPENDGDEDFHTERKKNMCVGCGEGNHYIRHRIIPSIYKRHFPAHLKGHRPYDILLVCVDCHLKANSFAEKYKKKLASEYGIPLSVHKVVVNNSSGGGGVSVSDLRAAAQALLKHRSMIPPQRCEELTQVVRRYYGGREITDEDLKNALLVGRGAHKRRYMRKKRGGLSLTNVSDTEALNSDVRHGKLVVDYLLKEHGEDGILEFCQRWRQVFVEAINPRFLPAGWDVRHSRRREFGAFSIYNPANKASAAAAAAKDPTNS